MNKGKYLLGVLILLFFTEYQLFAQNNTAGALDGTWIVNSLSQGDLTIDELLMKKNNLEYNVIIENNIGMMIRIANGAPTSAVKFEVVGNTMRDEYGGEIPYKLDKDTLTIKFPKQNLVITCRKKAASSS